MPELTIFTATYNRGHLIHRIYNSLNNQSKFDFEWLVIDDGSTDNTSQIFEEYLKRESKYPIRYYAQSNQGLIRSLNRGIELAKGKYFIKLDSDDYVTDYFIEKILSWVLEIKNESCIYGVGGLKVTKDEIPLKGIWPTIPKDGFVDATDLERKKYNLDADMTEAWSLNILRKYKFPVWSNEKFAPEQIIFHDIALKGYKIRWRPIPLTICEYQQGGLTLGANSLEKNNPMGYAMMYNHMLRRNDMTKYRKFHAAANHIALSIVGKNPQYIIKTNSIKYTLIGLIPGIMLSIRRYIQYRKR